MFTLTRTPAELKFRGLEVTDILEITPRYRRIVVSGPDAAGFVSRGADDHVRLFFPPRERHVPDDGERPESREYTPVAWDDTSLTFDFVVHDGGMVTSWLTQARIGDPVWVGGPRGSLVLDGSPDWFLLAGDLTALPAIRRFAAAAAPGVPVDVAVLGPRDDRQDVDSPGELSFTWVDGTDTADLLAAVGDLPRRDGDGLVFIAAEASIVPGARALLAERGIDSDTAIVKGYWRRGESEYHAPH